MKRWLFLLLLIIATVQAHAETVVIVNANSRITELSRDEVIGIFMGRYRKLPNGSVMQPVEIKGETAERRNFYQRLMDKSLAEINAYWARLVFSGRTIPPEGLETQREVLERVARDPEAIGYVEGIRLNSHVKVVYRLAD